MKVLLFILLITATAWADDCDSSFGTFLNSLKSQVTDDSKIQGLEQESVDDYASLVHKCFADSTSDSSKCALTDDELNGDVYGDTGPLRGCDRCQTLVKGLRDKFMGSSESTRKCFRTHFADAVRKELQPCIQNKISNGLNFEVPAIPDFDEKTFNYINVVEKGIDNRIMVRSRLDVCRQANPSKFSNTGPCMDNGYSGIYSKHCQCSKNAKRSVPSSCRGRFDEVKKATVECLNEKRDDWHTRFDKIKQIVENANNAQQCGKDISDVLGTWLGDVQKALSDCMPSQSSGSGSQTRDLRTLIELGCGQVINGGVKKNELTVGFRFVRLFLDALSDRIAVYVDKNCNF